MSTDNGRSGARERHNYKQVSSPSPANKSEILPSRVEKLNTTGPHGPSAVRGKDPGSAVAKHVGMAAFAAAGGSRGPVDANEAGAREANLGARMNGPSVYCFLAGERLGICSYLWSPNMDAAVDDEQSSELPETLLYFLCPHCKSPEGVPKSEAGKPRNCKACGKEFIPDPLVARPTP
jgi:hypothetical protein